MQNRTENNALDRARRKAYWRLLPLLFLCYVVRFLLGLAEAGFFPGVIVYLTHWFPAGDRTRALSWFLIATPVAQITSPKISNALTWLVILPPYLALGSQLFVGWNSDRTKERRYHAAFSILLGLVGLALAPLSRGYLPLTIACFMIAMGGIKAYQPAFWSLPSLFLTETAAAGSIGLINSVGNLGGFLGPTVLGTVQKFTGSFIGGIYFLVGSMAVCTTIILLLGVGRRETQNA